MSEKANGSSLNPALRTFMFPSNRGRPRTGLRRLMCGKLDLNDVANVRRIVEALAKILADPSAWHKLEVYNECYFRTPDGHITGDPGWYVICDDQRTPLYVGKADILYNRLNTTSGSLDQFANSQRTSDPTRNFIKVFCSIGYISTLGVAVVREPDLLHRIEIQGPLNNLDRCNIEKMLGLFRHTIVRRIT